MYIPFTRISRFFLLIFFCSFFGVAPLKAQNLGLAWAKHFTGGSSENGFDIGGNHIALDRSENVITTGVVKGRTDYNPGTDPADTFFLSSSTFISKLDQHGRFIWARAIDASSSRGVTVDRDDNIYIVGSFSGTVDFNPGKGAYNMSTFGNGFWDRAGYLLKLNAKGEFVWAQKMEATVCDNVTVDSLNNVFVCGSTEDASGLIIKFDSEGNEIFQKKFIGLPNGQGMKGGIFTMTDIMIDADQNIYATGSFYGILDFDPDPVGTNILDVIGYHIFVLKLDSLGAYEWVKNIGPIAATGYLTIHTGSALARDPGGNVYVTGFFRNTLDFNPWGPPIFLSTVDPLSSSAFILKFKPDGVVSWAKGLDNTWGFDIEVDQWSNVYVLCRLIRDSTDLDPGPGVAMTRMKARRWDAAINKHDSAGNYIWTKRIEGAEYVEAKSFSLSKSQSLYTTGFYTDKADFDPGPDTFYMTAPLYSIYDGVGYNFIQKLGCTDTNSAQLEVSTCGSVYRLNGVDYMESGQYMQVLPNHLGCDSTVHLALTMHTVIHPVITVKEFELSTIDEYNTYQWILEDEIIPGATGRAYTVSENGRYRVVVTGGSGDCTDTSGVYYVTNATDLGVVDPAHSQLAIYPNPANDVVHLKSGQAMHLQLYTIDGRMMAQDFGRKLGLKGIAPGLYMLHIVDASGQLRYVYKLMKK